VQFAAEAEVPFVGNAHNGPVPPTRSQW
jgi:hypothetical protein